MEGGVLIRTSVVLYALLVTSVHIIIDLMVVILDSNSAPRTPRLGRSVSYLFL